MKSFSWLSPLLIAISFLFSYSNINAQTVHCYTNAYGVCAVDTFKENPSSCVACPDPNDISTCCDTQSPDNCRDVICAVQPTATPTPTVIPGSTATPTTPPDQCTPGNPANCNSGAGCFFCEWDHTFNVCAANFPQNQCKTNHQVDNDLCSSLTQSQCNSECGTNLLCKEANVALGYRCEGPSLGCFPCVEGDQSPKCNPPQYQDVDACNAACSGQTDTLYACVDGECVESGSGVPIQQCAVMCSNVPNPLGTAECGPNALYTGIGCIPISSGDDFMGFIFGWAIGIAGGIALLLIVYAGIEIMTAAGNPQKIQAGKELLTAAIAGFLFLLLSAYMLRFIGIEVLQIPGL